MQSPESRGTLLNSGHCPEFRGSITLLLYLHRSSLPPGEPLTGGRQALRKLLSANQRPQTAYPLKESFDQLWEYFREGWARRFFDNRSGIAAYRESEKTISSRFVEGINTKIRVIQRPGVRPPGRRVPPPESPHLHTTRDLK